MQEPVAVIGSGPAGAVAAQALLQRGIPVVMLESGEALPGGLLVRVNGRNVFRRVPKMHQLSKPHFAIGGHPETQWLFHLDPGGLSNHWTGAVPRMAPADFTEGEQLDTRYRWPLNYEDLAPFYTQAEQLMIITGGRESLPMVPAGTYRYHRRLPKAWRAIGEHARLRGQGLIPMPLADGSPWLTARRGTAFNSFTQIIQPLLKSPDFKLILGAHVLRLELDSSQKQVTTLIYQDRATNTEHRLHIRAAILACGALNSTKLLFDSACTAFPHGLGNENGVLGRYLHDHPHEWFAFEVDKPLPRLGQAAYLSRRAYGYPPLMATGSTLGAASFKEKLLSHTPVPSTIFGVQVFGTMIPTEDNFVAPDGSQTDAFGNPILRICMDYDKDVRENLNASRKNLLDILRAAGYESRIIHEPNPIRPGTSVHYGGTVRMHHSREFGVLDGWNRLHAVPNVLVTDASCFTTCPEKNPTLTVMALSLRAAYQLADRLQGHMQ